MPTAFATAWAFNVAIYCNHHRTSTELLILIVLPSLIKNMRKTLEEAEIN